MAPVAGGVADREEDGLLVAERLSEGVGPPGTPVDRVVLMLEEIGTGFVAEQVLSHDRVLVTVYCLS
jgi:hypothetical protein